MGKFVTGGMIVSGVHSKSLNSTVVHLLIGDEEPTFLNCEMVSNEEIQYLTWTVYIGDSVNLVVVRNGHVLYGRKYALDGTMLTILNPDVNDTGRYECSHASDPNQLHSTEVIVLGKSTILVCA